MSASKIQKLIYHTTHNRPTLNRALDAFGRGLNRVGIKWRTGFARHRAVVEVSHDPAEIQRTIDTLVPCNNSPGWSVVWHSPVARQAALQRVPVAQVMELDRLGIEPQKLSGLFSVGGSEGNCPLVEDGTDSYDHHIKYKEAEGVKERTYHGLIAAARSLQATGIEEDKRADLLLAFWWRAKGFRECDWETGIGALEFIPRLVEFLQRSHLNSKQIEAYLKTVLELGKQVGPNILLASAITLGEMGIHPDQIATLQTVAFRTAKTNRIYAGDLLGEISSMSRALLDFGLSEVGVAMGATLVSLFEEGQNAVEARRALARELMIRTKDQPGALQLVTRFKLANEVGFLFNDSTTPPEVKEAVIANADQIVAESWDKLLNGRPSSELPRVFEFCARVMAEKAQFAYNRINAVAERTKKPTITVYVLSTAYKLNIENLVDQFLERGLSHAEAAAQIAAFQAEVARRESEGLSYFEAQLAVAQDWLDRDLLSRYTQPVYLKIPSGSDPASYVQEKLQELAALARANNYDIVFVDHSTVRTPNVTHQGDPSDFHKGRALARALEIVDPERQLRAWVYQVGRWEVPELAQERPNMVAINIYDGRIYESHTGGQKSDWLPLDDHGEFIGISWDADGNERYTDYLVITKNGNGRYVVKSAADTFEAEFHRAFNQLRAPVQPIKIPHLDILFVCNANHDRSPLAEFLMRRLMAERVEVAENIRVSSAGLIVDEWLEQEGPKKENPLIPSSGTRRLLDQRQIDHSQFRKRKVDSAMVAQADIIFVMTQRQKGVLLERFPEIAGKVHVLREYAGYSEQDRDIPTPRTFNYQTTYMFEEALARALQKMAGEELRLVRRIPKRAFRGQPQNDDYQAAA